MHAELKGLGDISETLFLPFYARVIESRSQRPILKDPAAEALADAFLPLFYHSERPLYRHFSRGKMNPLMVSALVLRTRYFDRLTRHYLQRFPQGQVVSLGVGLDTRFSRCDNGQATWVELDLPPVMALRAQLFESAPRTTRLTQSVLEHHWFEALPASPVPRLFLAEGLFMYLPETELFELLNAMQTTFKESELVCEMASHYFVKNWGWVIRNILQNHFHMRDQAAFHSGLGSAQELESRVPGLKVLDEWSYLDEKNELKILSWLRFVSMIRRFMWSLHSRF